jgi:hypothetical protein
MTAKGKPTFLVVDGIKTPQEQASASISIDTASLVRSVNALTEAVKAVKPEIRIDLPEMNPVINPSVVPVVVNVPELPANPAVSVTVPEFPEFPKFPAFPDIPSYPVVKIPNWLVLGVFFAFTASNVAATMAIDLIRELMNR